MAADARDPGFHGRCDLQDCSAALGLLAVHYARDLRADPVPPMRCRKPAPVRSHEVPSSHELGVRGHSDRPAHHFSDEIHHTALELVERAALPLLGPWGEVDVGNYMLPCSVPADYNTTDGYFTHRNYGGFSLGFGVQANTTQCAVEYAHPITQSSIMSLFILLGMGLPVACFCVHAIAGVSTRTGHLCCTVDCRSRCQRISDSFSLDEFRSTPRFAFAVVQMMVLPLLGGWFFRLDPVVDTQMSLDGRSFMQSGSRPSLSGYPCAEWHAVEVAEFVPPGTNVTCNPLDFMQCFIFILIAFALAIHGALEANNFVDNADYKVSVYVRELATSCAWNATTLAVALGEKATRPVEFPGGTIVPFVAVTVLTCAAYIPFAFLQRYVKAPDHHSALSLPDISVRLAWAAFFGSVNIWLGAAIKIADAARGIAALSWVPPQPPAPTPSALEIPLLHPDEVKDADDRDRD